MCKRHVMGFPPFVPRISALVMAAAVLMPMVQMAHVMRGCVCRSKPLVNSMASPHVMGLIKVIPVGMHFVKTSNAWGQMVCAVFTTFKLTMACLVGMGRTKQGIPVITASASHPQQLLLHTLGNSSLMRIVKNVVHHKSAPPHVLTHWARPKTPPLSALSPPPHVYNSSALATLSNWVVCMITPLKKRLNTRGRSSSLVCGSIKALWH